MTRLKHLFEARWTLLVLIGFVSALAILPLGESTRHGGAGVSPDSLHYIAAAQNFVSDGIFLRYEGYQYVNWPPLYPLLLAGVNQLARWVDLPFIEAIRGFQLLSYVALVLAAGLVLRQQLESRALVLVGTVAVLLGFPILRIHVLAWSEPLFILLLLIFFLILPGWLRQPTWRGLLGLIVTGVLICLQRYTGTLVVGLVGLWMLLFAQTALWRRVIYAGVFGAMSLLPLMAWFARNYALTETFTGGRSPADVDLDVHVRNLVNNLRPWFMQVNPFGERDGLALGVMATVGLIAVAVAYLRPADQIKRQMTLLIGVFALGYVAFILYSSATYAFDSIGQRLLAPAYIPLIVVLLVALERLAVWVGERFGRPAWGGALALVLVLVWLLHPYQMTRREIGSFDDWCCQLDAWGQSSVIDWLQTHPLDGVTLSNTPLPLYLGVTVYRIPTELNDLDDDDVPLSEVYYLVWFDDIYDGKCPPGDKFCYHTDFDLDALKAATPLEMIAETDDGVVYRFLEPVRTANAG